MIRTTIRWANRQHRGALTGLLTGAIPFALLLWLSSAMNWTLFSIGLMWAAALVLVAVFTAPVTFGLVALVSRFSLKSIGDLFLMLWVVIACLGSIAILAGILHIGIYYPAYIFFLSMAIAAMLRSGTVNLEFWMKVVAGCATALMVLVTVVSLPKSLTTIGVSGPEAAEAAEVRAQASKKAADKAQAECIGALVGSYTEAQAIKACPLRFGVQETPQAPRTPTAVEKAQADIDIANLKAHETKALECLQWYREIVEGYVDGKKEKVEPRVLTRDEETAHAKCTGELNRVHEKLKKAERVSQGMLASPQGSVDTERLTVIYFDPMDPKTYGPAIAKFGVLHIVGLVVIGIFAWLFLKKKDGTTAKSTTATGGGWKTLAIIMILGGAGYFAWNNPTISAGVKGGLLGASRGMTAAEIPVWDKFLTKEFVAGHGTKAIMGGVGGEEFDINVDDRSGLIQLTTHGGEVYGLSSGPCSAPAKMASETGSIMMLSVCSGNWRGGGKSGTYTATFNPTYNEMYRIAEFRDSSNPRKETFRMVFR